MLSFVATLGLIKLEAVEAPPNIPLLAYGITLSAALRATYAGLLKMSNFGGAVAALSITGAVGIGEEGLAGAYTY